MGPLGAHEGYLACYVVVPGLMTAVWIRGCALLLVLDLKFVPLIYVQNGKPICTPRQLRAIMGFLRPMMARS